jgi:hypothetical protein
MPVPTFVSPPPPDITPEKVVLLLLEPTERIEPVGTKTPPEPDSDPIVPEPPRDNPPAAERTNGARSDKEPVLDN